jgi:hypothetical protein
MLWGFVLPPVVALISVVALLEADVMAGWQTGDTLRLTTLLFITGITLVCATLFFVSLPVRTLGARINDFRHCLVFSFLCTLVAVVLGGVLAATKFDSYHYYEESLYVCLPLFGFCVGVLWLAVGKMERIQIKALTLGGFLAATVLIQFYILKSDWSFQDEQNWSLNSMLVGLAFAIWLCAWGAKEFRRNGL